LFNAKWMACFSVFSTCKGTLQMALELNNKQRRPQAPIANKTTKSQRKQLQQPLGSLAKLQQPRQLRSKKAARATSQSR